MDGCVYVSCIFLRVSVCAGVQILMRRFTIVLGAWVVDCFMHDVFVHVETTL